MTQEHDQLMALASLGDPIRRRLYDLVASRPTSVTREEASAALGIERAVAAYHLDVLVEHGLLTASFARPPGRRGGPGAGRPAKHYQRASGEVGVTLPARDYELAARILARAAELDPGPVRRALERAAAEAGHELADQQRTGSLEALLRAQGYEPEADAEGVVRLRNCPFHRLAQQHTDLVCGMNLALLRGALEALDGDGYTAHLEPLEGSCCVAFHPQA